MLFKRSATLHCGFAIKTQCGREEQLCCLRSISANLELPRSDFFLFVRNFDNVAERRLIFLLVFSKLMERDIISFLLSMGKTFQNRYLIENFVVYQNNFVCLLLISLGQNHKLPYFPCSRRGLRQCFRLEGQNCAGESSQTFPPASSFSPLLYVLAIQGTGTCIVAVVCVCCGQRSRDLGLLHSTKKYMKIGQFASCLLIPSS